MVAEVEGAIVGFARSHASFTENTEWLSFMGLVSTEFQGQGIDTALALKMAELGKRAGRPRLEMAGEILVQQDFEAPNLPINHVAASLGLTRKSMAIGRLAQIPLDPGVAAELAGAIGDKAAGYRLISWQGRLPGEHLDAMAKLATQLEQDDPTEDAEYEPPVWTPARIREYEDRAIAAGHLTIGCAAMASNGDLVGYSEIEVNTSPGTTLARQGDTLVMPEHRGHRLGLAMKLNTHLRLPTVAPGVMGIDTWNTHINESMISINEAMGYVPRARYLLFQN